MLKNEDKILLKVFNFDYISSVGIEFVFQYYSFVKVLGLN